MQNALIFLIIELKSFYDIAKENLRYWKLYSVCNIAKLSKTIILDGLTI